MTSDSSVPLSGTLYTFSRRALDSDSGVEQLLSLASQDFEVRRCTDRTFPDTHPGVYCLVLV